MRFRKLNLLLSLLTFLLGIGSFYGVRLLVGRIPTSGFLDPIPTFSSMPWVDQRLEENAIYGTIIREQFVDKTTTFVTIEAMSTNCEIYEKNSFRTPPIPADIFSELRNSMLISKETTDSYLAKNQSSSEILLGDIGINYRIVSAEEINGYFDERGKGWEEFYKKYPKSSGLIFFSRVGFNSQHNEAFVYVGHTCGGLCGSGGYVSLKKLGAGWAIQKSEGVWVS
jgi:hypothetical protein